MMSDEDRVRQDTTGQDGIQRNKTEPVSRVYKVFFAAMFYLSLFIFVTSLATVWKVIQRLLISNCLVSKYNNTNKFFTSDDRY